MKENRLVVDPKVFPYQRDIVLAFEERARVRENHMLTYD